MALPDIACMCKGRPASWRWLRHTQARFRAMQRAAPARVQVAEYADAVAWRGGGGLACPACLSWRLHWSRRAARPRHRQQARLLVVQRGAPV